MIAVVAGSGSVGAPDRGGCGLASPRPLIRCWPSCVAALADVAPQPPAIPVLSTVDQGMAARRCSVPTTGWPTCATPVRFAEAIAAAGAEHGIFVEISPHPLLTHAITETLGDVHHHALGTLHRDTHDTLTFHTNLNTTHTTHPTAPPTTHPNPTPTYPPHPGTTPTTGSPPASAAASVSAPQASARCSANISPCPRRPHTSVAGAPGAGGQAIPRYHRLHGVEVVPVSVLLQTFLTAASELGVRRCHATSGSSSRSWSTGRRSSRSSRRRVAAVSRSGSAADVAPDRWTTHVTARTLAARPARSEWHRDTTTATRCRSRLATRTHPIAETARRARGRGPTVRLVDRFLCDRRRAIGVRASTCRRMPERSAAATARRGDSHRAQLAGAVRLPALRSCRCRGDLGGDPLRAAAGSVSMRRNPAVMPTRWSSTSMPSAARRRLFGHLDASLRYAALESSAQPRHSPPPTREGSPTRSTGSQAGAGDGQRPHRARSR